MRYILFLFLLMTALLITGCVRDQETSDNSAQTISVSTSQHKITDGFWCRTTTWQSSEGATTVRHCFQFYADGTFASGYFPGGSMTKPLNCKGPSVSENCEYWKYTINSAGQYEVPGYTFTLKGDTLTEDTTTGDNIPFLWSSSII